MNAMDQECAIAETRFEIREAFSALRSLEKLVINTNTWADAYDEIVENCARRAVARGVAIPK